MTNIDVSHIYAKAYPKSSPFINPKMTLLLRQLPAGEYGLPIEIDCYTLTTIWAEYEGTQGDVFDHLLAAANHFGLEVFQNPSGSYVIRAGEQMTRLMDNELPKAWTWVKAYSGPKT